MFAKYWARHKHQSEREQLTPLVPNLAQDQALS